MTHWKKISHVCFFLFFFLKGGTLTLNPRFTTIALHHFSHTAAVMAN